MLETCILPVVSRRWCPLTLCPPRHRKREGLPTVALWAVQVCEIAPPTNEKMCPSGSPVGEGGED